MLRYRDGAHVYTCGPEDARHLEYFSVPEVPDYVNHPFTLRLAKTGRETAMILCQSRAVEPEGVVEVEI